MQESSVAGGREALESKARQWFIPWDLHFRGIRVPVVEIDLLEAILQPATEGGKVPRFMFRWQRSYRRRVLLPVERILKRPREW